MMRCDPVAVRLALTFTCIAGALVACTGELSAPASGDFNTSSARNVSTALTVSGTSPDSATQDTTLDVIVSGSGFVSGATAAWALHGVEDAAQVRTNSTRYVNPKQLVANITISATATIGSWDVIVRAGGKGGIGTEAFAIKPKGGPVDTNSRVNIVFDNSMNLAPPGAEPQVGPTGIQGDSRDKNGAASAVSEYQGAFCGVDGKIFWSGTNFGGDMVFNPNATRNAQTLCGAGRFLKYFLSYQQGGSIGAATNVVIFTNIRAVMLMAVGEVISRRAFFNYSSLPNCDRIAFDATLPGAVNVRVTRLADDGASRRWRVESEYPHFAMCTQPKGQSYLSKGLHYLPFGYTVTEIPYPYPSNP